MRCALSLHMSILEDVRFGLRTLGKNRGFAAVAITALALGIGVNATVFSLANAVLFKNLPFANSDKILYIVGANTKNPSRNNRISYPDYKDLQGALKSFDAVGAAGEDSANLSDHTASPESYHGARISANTFSLIGQKPVAGRDFVPSDEVKGATPVAIISYRVWENRYGKDQTVIGRSVRIEDVPTVIIGVMPARLDFPRETEIWQPLIPSDDDQKRENRKFMVYGHIASGASIKTANAEVGTVMQRLASAYPITNKDLTGHVIDFNEFFAGNESGIKVIFLAMVGAVGFVLLIACANVANLQLARAVSRTREISVRVALGAGRWRIIRQLLIESLMISIAGGAIGWLLAIWGTRAFDTAVSATGKPPFLDFSMDPRALLYLAAITIGTGLLFGLAPALRLSKLDVNTALKDGGRGSSGGGRGKYLSGLLVVTEMALAVVLLAGAGLMIRSFLHAYHSDLGFDSTHMLTMNIDLPAAKYEKPEQQLAFFNRVKAQLDSTPGVGRSAMVTDLPLSGWWTFSYEVEGVPQPDSRNRPTVDAVIASPDYFQVLGVHLLAGREFTTAEESLTSQAVIVNRQFAIDFLHGENVLGKRIRLYKKEAAEPWLTIVGLAPNITQHGDTRNKTSPLIYLPIGLKMNSSLTLAARTTVPPATLKETFRREVQALDDTLPVNNLRTMEEQLERNNWPYRVFGILFAIFAGIALLLASVGLYAVMAHSVSQRTQEIGVRMALGANSGNVLRLIFTQGMRQLILGLAIGLAGALAVTKVLKTLLIDVSPSDPATFFSVALVLAIAAGLGCLIPAMRAMRVDPIEALRHE
jgi:putative ABC transport system permease protein